MLLRNQTLMPTLVIFSLSMLTHPVPSQAISEQTPDATHVQGSVPQNLQPPPSMESLQILSQGAQLNALVYLPGGPGPHPIVIFLHGYPGNERNLDLAQRVRRAGYIALYFDYRGDFGSGGTFSFAHSREDTAAALAWAHAPENVAKYGIDPSRIALVGHSLGGWLALFGAQHEPPEVCVAALAAWNIGWAASRIAGHPDKRAETLDFFRTTSDAVGGPIHANADDLLQEWVDHAAAWDYSSLTNSLGKRALLLVAATRDTADESVERHTTLAQSIRKADGKLVRMETFDDDHPFSSHRVELGELLVHWLQGDCRKMQGNAR
jgi:uncharacterized protein